MIPVLILLTFLADSFCLHQLKVESEYGSGTYCSFSSNMKFFRHERKQDDLDLHDFASLQMECSKSSVEKNFDHSERLAVPIFGW